MELLRDAWPLQTAVKSPQISAQLCDIALSGGDRFKGLLELILPLLTPIEGDRLYFHSLRDPNDGAIEKFPAEVLTLLHAVLPEDVSAWPHGIESILERIGVTQPALLRDERLIELKRKWSSR
jgi:hypothetical protein